MLALQNAQDIELLCGDFKRFKKILLFALQPACSIKKIYQRLLMTTLERFLFYFFFDIHGMSVEVLMFEVLKLSFDNINCELFTFNSNIPPVCINSSYKK